jgi:hypothetical protein
MWEVGLPPSPVAFSSMATFTSYLTPGCWAGAATPAFSGQHVYLQFHEGLPLPVFSAQGTMPSLLCVFVVVYYSDFFFFPWVGVGLTRGLC